MPAFPIWDLHRLAPEVRPDLPGLSTLAIYYVQYGPKSPNTQHLLSLFPLSTIQLQGFCEYSEDLVARIDAPWVRSFDIQYFSQPA